MADCLRNVAPQISDSLPMYLSEFVGSLIITSTFSLVTQPNLTYFTSPGLDCFCIVSAKYSQSILSDTNAEATQESFVAPIAVGFVMIALIYAFGHISGAHC